MVDTSNGRYHALNARFRILNLRTGVCGLLGKMTDVFVVFIRTFCGIESPLFSLLGVSLGCLGVSLGCLGVSLGCLGVSLGCLGASLGFHNCLVSIPDRLDSENRQNPDDQG